LGVSRLPDDEVGDVRPEEEEGTVEDEGEGEFDEGVGEDEDEEDECSAALLVLAGTEEAPLDAVGDPPIASEGKSSRNSLLLVNPSLVADVAAALPRADLLGDALADALPLLAFTADLFGVEVADFEVPAERAAA
jgi:hypothetical protein